VECHCKLSPMNLDRRKRPEGDAVSSLCYELPLNDILLVGDRKYKMENAYDPEDLRTHS